MPVKLHALRSLTSLTGEIWHWLTLPRLERLHIQYRIKSMEATINALHAFVSRSSCTLKFLSVRFSYISGPAQMQHLFLAANTIEHLKVFIDQSTGASLMGALRSADVLPWLKRLEVHHWTTVAGDPARLLLDMLAWRRTHGVLESFELVVIVNEPPDVLAAAVIAEFRALGEAGLEVRITARKRGNSASPAVVLLDTRQQAA
jgi:hypothetical protein